VAQHSFSTPLLELSGITKDFPGTRALDGVSFKIHAGEIVALLGENGAGKSTLMKILSGIWATGSHGGEVRVARTQGKAPVLQNFRDTRDAHAAGIAMIHQELAVFSQLTIGEHLALDSLPIWIDWNEVHARSQKFLDGLNFGLRSETRVGELSVGGKQMVEIARALYRNSKILVFDEPTSALTEQEVLVLYRVVEKLRAEGHAIIYITHKLDEVFHLADRMVVLRDGKNAGEASAREGNTKIPRATLEPKLISWMVGRPITDVYPPRNKKFGDEILRVEKLTVKSPNGKTLVRDLSFAVKRGEVLGLGGLLGAGRSETFEGLFGVLDGRGPRGEGFEVLGNVWINGRRKKAGMPSDAIAARMAFVSEDRKGSGLVIGQSIRSNITLPSLVSGRKNLTRSRSALSGVNGARELAEAQVWMKELKVKAASIEQSVGTLSGGNQQKVVLAKWLLTDPEILFLDEPTRGIDVGAKVEIYQWIQKLAANGMAIIVVSSEMPELLGISHRLLILREGHLSAELPAEGTTQEDIMRAASL